MADLSYNPKVYRQQGGARLVVASSGSADVESGGEIDIEAGGQLKVGGTALVTTGGLVDIGSLGAVFKHYVEQATTSFATITAYGVSIVRAATAATMPMAAPVAGIEKWITAITTAATLTLTASSAGADLTTAGSTQISITTGTALAPSWIHLVGLNSTRYLVLGQSANVTVS